MAKIDTVLDAGLRAVEIAQRGGVPMAYGTDLLGAMHRRQLSEFALRSEVVPAAELLRSATCLGADLLGIGERHGRSAPGHVADLIAFDGDPLADIGIMATLERRLRMVVKGGTPIA